MATHGRQQYFADELSLQKERREFSISDEVQQKIDGIEPGAQVNKIDTVKVNGTALVPDANKAVNINVPDVIDNLYTVDSNNALSAKQGKILYDYIQNLLTIGRFLSNWDSSTGLPMTNPSESPYTYKAGDYYRVSNVAVSPATNYKPNGSSFIIGQASTTVETSSVAVSDLYLYDGTSWILLSNSGSGIAVDSSLSTTSTNPVENRVITNALNGKQEILIAGNNIQIAADGKTISATDTTYTAGANISIDANNQISATDTTYTAGTGISIDANNVISNTQTSAEWGNITGDISDQIDLMNLIDTKQDLLTSENAGRDISITNGAGGDETVTGNTSILLEDAIADGLNSVTISGKTKQTYLPDGYTEYEYIHTSGKYFVTDYYPNNKTEVKTKIFMDGQPGSPLVTRWATSPTNDTFGLYMGNVSNRLTFFYGRYSDNKYTNVEGVKTNMEYSIYMGVSNIVLDGTSYSTTRSTFTSTQPIYIGAFNQTGTSLAGTLTGRIYKVEFIENGNVVRRYIPCKNANNEIGLYETVTSTFITSAGTGNLKSGKIAEKSDTLPSEYTRLDYIQATGTQYIDSGVVGNFATNKIEQNAVVEYTTSSSDRELMGTNGYGFWGKSASNKIEAALGQTTVTDNALAKNNVSWTTDPDGNKLTLNVNSNQYTSTASSFVDADYSYYIFALGIRVGSGSSASFFCKAKVYSYTIAIDDEVVCDLVPCKRNSDNVLGMYDLVSGTFKTNAGTGTFTAGNVYSTLNPDNPQPIICNNGVLSYIPSIADFSSGLIKRSTNTVVTMTGTKDSITYTFGSSSGYVGKVFPVTVGRTYTVSYNELTTSGTSLVKVRFVELDSDVSVIDNNYGTDITSPYTFTATKSYVGLWICYPYTVTGNVTIEVKGLMLAEGSQQAGLYVDGITETVEDEEGNTATAEMLLSIGDYTDTQEILSGAITRKVGIKVLDGTETISKALSTTSPLGYYFAVEDTDISHIQGATGVKTPSYCTHFENVINAGANLDNGKMTIAIVENRFYMAYAGVTTAEGFAQYLAEQFTAGTPVIVVYPLATETTETVTGQTLTTIQGDNTLTITQGSIDNLPIEANYDKIGGLTISFVNDDGFQTVANMRTDLNNPDDTHYPTTKAIADAIEGIGGADIDVENQSLIITDGGGGGGGGGGIQDVLVDGTSVVSNNVANINLSGKQDVSNLVTSVSSSSTDSQYPSAKLFYDTCGDIETLINAL